MIETNRVDTSPDAALENVTLNEGATQSVAFRVTVQGNDGDGGCNIDSGEQLTVQVISSDTSVAMVSPQTLTFTGCNQDQSVTVTALARGTATITVAQAPGPGSNTTGSGTFDYTPASFTVTVNAPPTISDIPDQITDEDTPTGDIPFTVGDTETPASDLTVSGSSSNTRLVPNANIVFGGSGANRTVKATPAANRSGTATITVSVSDGLATTSTVKVNTVNDAPTVAFTSGPTQVDESGTEAHTYTFEITDPDSSVFSFASGYPDCGGGGELVGTPQIGDRSFGCRFPDGPARPTVRIQVTDSQGADSNIATQSLTVADVTPTLTISGPSKVKQGQTKTYRFSIIDPGEDTFDFAANYPRCGNGAVLVGENMVTDRGSFQCKFVEPAKPTLVVRVEDLDGGLSTMARWQVKVEVGNNPFQMSAQPCAPRHE